MKLLGLFDAATGLLMEGVPSSQHVSKQSGVSQLHPLLSAGDVLLGDRGFCSFWHVAMLMGRGGRGGGSDCSAGYADSNARLPGFHGDRQWHECGGPVQRR
jgi:hypothetical protein